MNDALNAAELRVREALHVIDEAWKSNPLIRTTRLADAISLLERAAAKLKKEKGPLTRQQMESLAAFALPTEATP